MQVYSLNKEKSQQPLIAALKNKAQIEQSALHSYLVEKKKNISGKEKDNLPVALPNKYVAPEPRMVKSELNKLFNDIRTLEKT